MLYNKIENNMGIGISAAVLTGEVCLHFLFTFFFVYFCKVCLHFLFTQVREAKLSAFTPLSRVPLPYHVFGMVNICDPQKEIVIEERILLYYKYDNNPVDCVKVFSSIYDIKPIGKINSSCPKEIGSVHILALYQIESQLLVSQKI